MHIRDKKTVIMFIVESGDLENKSKLLVKSLLMAINKDIKNIEIVGIKPRKGKPLEYSTIKFFNESNVKFYDVDLNLKWNLPYANQAYATAYIESLYKGYQIIYLDSDIICLNNPLNFYFDDDKKIAIAPDITKKNNVQIFYGHPINKYWITIAELLNLDYNKLFKVKNSLDRKDVYSYFNTGVIIEFNADYGIFQKWAKCFDVLYGNEYINTLDNKRRFYLDQVILSLLIVNEFTESEIQLLTYRFNYHLPIILRLKHFFNISINFDRIVFLHYHWEFYNNRWLSEVNMTITQKKFLKENLPLPLTLHENFKKHYFNFTFLIKLIKTLSLTIYFLKLSKNNGIQRIIDE